MKTTYTDAEYRAIQFGDIPITGFEFHKAQWDRVNAEDQAILAAERAALEPPVIPEPPPVVLDAAPVITEDN